MKFNPKVFTNRAFLVVLLMVVFASCKTAQTGTSAGEHYEDLSYLRPEVVAVDENLNSQPEVEEEVFIPEPTMDITDEIASYSSQLDERRKAQGYDRYYIQIYSGNNRAKANAASAEIKAKYPSYKPETTYDQPNFKVRIGHFLEKLDAWPVYKQLRGKFPSAVLIPERVRP